MTPRMEKVLEGFHHRSLRWIAGMVPKCQRYGTWLYPRIGTALTTVGMDNIRVYTAWHQNMFSQYITTNPFMDLCLVAEQKPRL